MRTFTSGENHTLREHPFGKFAPTPLQRRVIAVSRASPFLNRGVLRRSICRWLGRMRPGPIDAQLPLGNFRLWCHENLSEAGILLYPHYNAQELRFLSEGISDGFFVDIGANIGLYSIAVATRVPSARVLAIEPGHVALVRLRTNIEASALSDRITVAPVGVGAEEFVGELVFEGSLARARVEPSATGGLTILPLPRILDDYSVEKIDSLKIDIEGREAEAMIPLLEEGRRLPRRIVIEHLHQDHWDVDLMAELQRVGYRELGRTRANSLLQRG